MHLTGAFGTSMHSVVKKNGLNVGHCLLLQFGTEPRFNARLAAFISKFSLLCFQSGHVNDRRKTIKA